MASTPPRRFDVCNGDADGLCAVRQWRGVHPAADARLLTGLKREIALLERVPVDQADEVLVCDISLERNRAALLRLLERGVRVRWFDHHAAGEVPRHPGLEAHLDFASGVCSSLLVDHHLRGAQRAWALVGAFGDELVETAEQLATASGFDAEQRAALCRLGRAINYNAYGELASDPLLPPAELYALIARHAEPLSLLQTEPVIAAIDLRRDEDLAQARDIPAAWQDAQARVVVLPDAPWSRRVTGTLANELAEAAPGQAQAVLRARPGGGYLVSVRAPRNSPQGAQALCRHFGGSGRAAAAGIDELPEADLGRFIDALAQAQWRVD